MKIHSGNYTNGTFGDNLFLTPYNVIHTDTFRIAIHITRGAIGDYWYDFDDFLLAYIVNAKEVHPLPSIILFPNPTNNKITFQLNEDIKSIQIKDVYGKPITFDYEINKNLQHEIQINPSLEFGTYFLSVKTDTRVINSKFIKE
ncbi:MAG: Secretion system C-terminal sorting domain [Bacteroidetes bacterium]|nr:Secretion system C-terminal sorting domain [Bacteroidota bacterium]